MLKNDTTLLLLAEGNRLPTRLGHLRHASMLSAKNLVHIGRPNRELDGVVGCSSQSRTTIAGRDHVDQVLVRVWLIWSVVHILI